MNIQSLVAAVAADTFQGQLVGHAAHAHVNYRND